MVDKPREAAGSPHGSVHNNRIARRASMKTANFLGLEL